MMKRTMLVIGFLLMVVMLGGWSPLPHGADLMSANAASDPTLTINNQTGTAFYLTATGPQTYTFHVLAGKNNFVVVKGEYSLSYYACGAQQTKVVNVKKSGTSIKLLCETAKNPSGKTPKLTIDNKSGGPIYVTFIGPKTYTFNAPAGKSNYSVEQGTYEVSYFACGAQSSQTFEVKKKGGTLKISCLAITFFNVNQSSNVALHLDGPASYYLNLVPGKTTVQMLPGTYDYELTSPCHATGTIKIKKKATFFVYCFP